MAEPARLDRYEVDPPDGLGPYVCNNGPWVCADDAESALSGAAEREAELVADVDLWKNRTERVKQQRDEAIAEVERLRGLLRRYRDETPPGHQPHMIAHLVDKALSTHPEQESGDD